MQRKWSWTPLQEERADMVLKVAEDLKPYWPLTLRQIYYRMVAVGRIENSRSSYNMLSKLVKFKRIDDRLPWRVLEDRSRRISDKRGFELTEDDSRNILIAEDVIHQARYGSGICLVLSDRKAHCLELHELIESLPGGVEAEVLTGDLSANARREVVERLNDGRVRVLVATGQLIGEGFDCRELSTLFLATPIKFKGRLIQYLGRVLRPAPGKDKAVVYDYVDMNVGVLRAAAKTRRRVYCQ